MNYKERLEKAESVKDLYDLREHLVADVRKYYELSNLEKTALISENTRKWQEACYYTKRVEAQIKALEDKGIFLNSIKS